MTALTGRQKKDTYKDLLQVSNSNQGIDTTLRTIEDGEGTQGPFQVSTTTMNVTGTLQKSGTTISATADELNKLASVSAGTASASKAAVLGANKNLDTLVIADGGLKLGAGAGTAVTATAAELNQGAVTIDIADGSADAVYYVCIPWAGAVTSASATVDGTVSTADITITLAIGATPMTDGVITIVQSTAQAGDIFTATPSAANSNPTANWVVKLTVAGGGSGGSPRVHVTLTVTR